MFYLIGFIMGSASNFSTSSCFCIIKVCLVRSRDIRVENEETCSGGVGVGWGSYVYFHTDCLPAHPPVELQVGGKRWKVRNGGASFTLVIIVRKHTACVYTLSKTGVLPLKW